MKRFVEGLDRGQSTLFPASLDDYVSEDNPVRAVDVFVDGLDLGKLGFVGVQPLDMPDQPDHLNIALAFPFQASARRNPIEIAVDLQLEHSAGRVTRSASGAGLQDDRGLPQGQ
jgi:hypothetical protein